LRDSARNPEHLATHLGDALRLWAISVVPLSVAAFVACRLLVPPALPAYAVAAIVLADLTGVSLLDLLARTWQAMQRVGAFGAAMAGLVVARLAAFCALLAIAPPGPPTWAVWYAVVTAVYVVLAGGAALWCFGTPRRSDTPFARLAAAGFPFAFAGSAMRIQAEANKPILARLDTMAGVGVYGAAQRMTDLLTMPIQALLQTLYPRAYRTVPTVSAIFTLGAMPMALAVTGAVLLIASADWLPRLLGEGYTNAVSLTRLLAFLPLLFVFRTLLTLIIAGRNRQTTLYGAHSLGAVVAVGMTLLLIPTLGSSGAAVAGYASEIGMIIFLATALALGDKVKTQ
jgi:O-antigen/teichoic acid export membrane protein